jgi:hypothetical protein
MPSIGSSCTVSGMKNAAHGLPLGLDATDDDAILQWTECHKVSFDRSTNRRSSTLASVKTSIVTTDDLVVIADMGLIFSRAMGFY